MRLQEQVCTLEQAKRLKELGVPQDSYFSWCGDETLRLLDNGKDGVSYSNWVFVASTEPVNNQEADYREDVPSAKPFAAAFTVAELGRMLPLGRTLTGWCMHDEQTCALYDENGRHITTKYGETEAQARAAMLIYVLENKLSKPTTP